VQVVTNNHAASMAAKDLMKEKMPSIFSTNNWPHASRYWENNQVQEYHWESKGV